MNSNKVYHGNCLDVLKTFPDNCIDSCVTDPPYGISFMNKHWDYQIPSVEIWQQVLRVLKPGGHLLCACGTRTQHRMVCNIEDAGFEIRDVISWIYGSGFPKSLDISKAIDRVAGVEREEGKPGKYAARRPNKSETDSIIYSNGVGNPNTALITEPVTDEAKQWEGWGTALKPATEFWTLARKPIEENTIAENVLKYGTGGLNIDGSRIELDGTENLEAIQKGNIYGSGEIYGKAVQNNTTPIYKSSGRFPANVIFDEFTGKILDEQSIENGIHSAGAARTKMVQSDYTPSSYDLSGERQMNRYEDDSIGASRFFYTPKADNFERNKGLKGFDMKEMPGSYEFRTDGSLDGKQTYPRANHHPTVKPIDLMRYLVKLITPKHGICVDPFCGSGTTLIGCKLELINYIGIDLNEEYCKIAQARVAAWNPDKYIAQTLF